MNRGFSYYFKSGMTSASYALKGESFMKRFSLLIYFLMSFIGKIIIFTRPIFVMADMNLAAMVRDCKSFSFAKIFQNTADGKRYGNLLLFFFIKDFVLLTACALIMIPCYILWALVINANLEPYETDYAILFYMATAVTIALGVLCVVFAFLFELNYIPAGYIASSNRKLDVSDYLYNSKQAMHGVKWTYFLLQLVYAAISLAILFVIGGTIAALLLYAEYYVSMIISVVIILISTILIIYFVQIFFLASLSSTYLVCRYSTSLDKVILVAETMDETENIENVLDEDEESLDLENKDKE